MDRGRTSISLGLLLFASSFAFAAERGTFEKTVPVPRTSDAELGWKNEGCEVESVTLRNYPDEEDISEARAKDPGDKSWLWWEFNVSNRGDRKCRIRLAIEILDKSGKVVKSGDRSGSVSPGELDDDIRLSTLMKTLDIADAAKVRIRATIGPE